MDGLVLLATGGALPRRVVTNDDLSRMVDTSDEWITSRTGMQELSPCRRMWPRRPVARRCLPPL